MHSHAALFDTLGVTNCYAISTNLVVIVLVVIMVSKLLACRFQAVCPSGQGSSGKARFSEHTVLIPLGMMRPMPKPKSQNAEQAISQKAPSRMS